MLLHKSFILKALCLFVLATSLSACGYQPLHGKRKTALNTAMQDELARTWVYEIEDREGQLLHNELLNLFNTKGRPKNPKYQLKLSYDESQTGLGIGKDDFATYAKLTVSAAFTFTGYHGLSGTSQSVVSYSILTSQRGLKFSKRDARLRAIKNVATDIHRRVAVHLLNPQQSTK